MYAIMQVIVPKSPTFNIISSNNMVMIKGGVVYPILLLSFIPRPLPMWVEGPGVPTSHVQNYL